MNGKKKQSGSKNMQRKKLGGGCVFRKMLWVVCLISFTWLNIFWGIKNVASFSKRIHVQEQQENIHNLEESIENYGEQSMLQHEKVHITSTSDDANLEWNLILVNHEHYVDEDYIAGIDLTQLRNGQSVDARCYPDLQKMMDDCRAEGYSPIICSSFRTYQRQQELFEEQVRVYMNQGLDRQEAEDKAEKSVAIPGTSEHELGLAVDITDIDNQEIVSGMESQPVQRWLMENCWKYGFILRYPSDKSDITGIVYEPWHYRYVGADAARYIYENQITLEEYLEE